MYYLIHIEVPEELWDDLRQYYPTFDFYGEVKLSTHVTPDLLVDGYYMFSRDPSYNPVRFLEKVNLGLEGLVLIPFSSVPEPLNDLIDKEILVQKKQELEKLKLKRYADMDESSFNNKNLED